jgi:hypothetical protein
MFDILRGKNADGDPAGADEKQKAEKTAPKSEPLSFPKEILKAPAPEPEEREDQSLVSKKLIFAVKQHGVDNQERADEIYEDAVANVKGPIRHVWIRYTNCLTPFSISSSWETIYCSTYARRRKRRRPCLIISSMF